MGGHPPSPGNPNDSIPEGIATMFIHVFLFQWKPEVTSADQQKAAAWILSLKDKIPGILEASYGANTSPRSSGYTHGGVMKFADQAGFEAYFAHPAHDELVAWLMPLLLPPAELDFPV